MFQKLLAVIGTITSLLGFNPPPEKPVEIPVVESTRQVDEIPNSIAQNDSQLPVGTTTETELGDIASDTPPASIKAKLADECFCVKIAKILGLKVPPGDAKDLVPNGTPDLGNGILFDYHGVRHIAVIQGFMDQGWLVEEGNFKKCKRTKRIVAWNDRFIIGFIKS